MDRIRHLPPPAAASAFAVEYRSDAGSYTSIQTEHQRLQETVTTKGKTIMTTVITGPGHELIAAGEELLLIRIGHLRLYGDVRVGIRQSEQKSPSRSLAAHR